MFYLITEQLVALAEKQGKDQKKACLVLEYLDIANRLGKHFVCAENSYLLDRVLSLNHEMLGYKELKNSYSFYASIGQSFLWHAEFVPSTERSYLDIDAHVVFISLDEINQFEVYRETQVLGENLSDIRFFERILSYFKKKNGFEKTHYCFHPLLGGGRTTSEVFKYECEKPLSFMLCISDGDFKYSGAALGETADAIKRVRNSFGDSLFNGYFYYYKEVREIENLITLSLLERYSKEPKTGLKKVFSVIKSLCSLDASYAPYLDLKEGISLHTLKNCAPGDPVLEAVKKVIPTIDSLIQADTSSLDPTLKGEAKKEEMKKKKYIRGLGNKILEHILEAFKQEDIVLEMEQNANPNQRREYDQIGRLLYDWTASSRRVRL